MLLNEDGLNIAAFEPRLAAAFGNTPGELGSKLISECMSHQRTMVLLRDWLFCLVQTGGTVAHKRLIQQPGQNVDTFVTLIEESPHGDDPESATIPIKLDRSTVADNVMVFLERAELLASECEPKLERVDDRVVTLALLENLDDATITLLRAWLGDEQYDAWIGRLQTGGRIVGTIFDDDGNINTGSISPGARTLLKRLVEDAASIGAKKIGAKNLLYTLLGDEGSLLTRSLALFGIDVKTQMHAPLARQLTRPGRKRNQELDLHRTHMLETVAKLLEQAQKLANSRDGRLLEHDVSVAFVQRQDQEIAQLLSGITGVEAAHIKEIVEDAEPDLDGDNDDALHSIPLEEIERKIKAVICGQGAAVDRVMPWIKRLRFGLPRDGRPAGVFLFLGPTGTGKTQLAKELARYVYGDPDQMIFLEMGQFKTKESMSMFIGAAPGYVGYGEGKLTNGLAEKPESVVLFDEIEKADTQVFDTLLRFADEGLISDPAGPVRDGRKCLLVMTTNAGQAWLREEVKTNPSVVDDPVALTERLFEAAMAEMAQNGFRPEFLGRVDERVTYLPFTKKTCASIVDLVLDREIEKLMDLKGVSLTVDEDARDLLADFAFARAMDEGARGAPRAVNELIITPAIDLLSDRMEESEYGDVSGTRVDATRVGRDNHITLELT